jgi:hypothetical protein
MKICTKCKIEKPIEDFYLCSRDGRIARCMSCVKEYQSTRTRKRDPAKIRANTLMREYGMTPADYNEMLADQGGTCKISTCDRPATVVDHNHDTGEVRGLLCNQHNTALGLAGDSPVHLRAMAQYLEDTSYYG